MWNLEGIFIEVLRSKFLIFLERGFWQIKPDSRGFFLGMDEDFEQSLSSKIGELYKYTNGLPSNPDVCNYPFVLCPNALGRTKDSARQQENGMLKKPEPIAQKKIF